jgi:hypothetical protein
VTEAEHELACGDHGKRPAAFVCEHLLAAAGAGFHWGIDAQAPDAPCPDAWCDACEKMLQAEGAWTDRAVAAAEIKRVCDLCYEKFRERNWGDDSKELKRVVRAGAAYLDKRQRKLEQQHKLTGYDRWDWNQEAGQLLFSQAGQRRLFADVVFVGGLSIRTNTWLWSWANPFTEESVKSKTREVRRYGEKQHILKLACARWSATEQDAWEMTGAAALLIGALGVYRIPSDNGFTFMLLTSVNWAQ